MIQYMLYNNSSDEILGKTTYTRKLLNCEVFQITISIFLK